MAQFRRRKTFGGVRLTLSQRGLGISVGKGPVRLSRGGDGRFRRTLRIPGSGIYDTKVVGGPTKRRPHGSADTPRVADSDPSHRSESGTTPLPPPEAWQLLVARDNTPTALTLQRNYVEATVGKSAAKRVRLRGLTLGQAERILTWFGDDPHNLHSGGRDRRWLNALYLSLLWLLLALVTGICLGIPTVGPLISAAIVAVAGYKLVQRQRELTRIARGELIPWPSPAQRGESR